MVLSAALPDAWFVVGCKEEEVHSGEYGRPQPAVAAGNSHDVQFNSSRVKVNFFLSGLPA